ncbi:unnamed protein product [Didymodactylos carnosus]|uniref:G-protein coupled receptors family 1 profile domain-containing protein n=1 Tax=Didymodactylos carnosus TaxID=1234261 RepID=A0A814YDF4_9BILA|nr:unnamed protein product [Didymodactylos carnosus]CAF1228879.1 unnamed protein product [Didymodactylos carnosus]CAF3759364.1 unnamed protein product [Didymodactylos carnosus]CAF3991604.1 unnamed protein product [Didymodactylos carnosus]
MYFFLLLSLTTKTAVGYHDYLKYTGITKPLSNIFYVLLFTSVLIAIVGACIAIGLQLIAHKNVILISPALDITSCKFSESYVYFFITIPISIFILINILMIILVAKHIVPNSETLKLSIIQKSKRRKHVVLLILASCATQGIAWLTCCCMFMPFLTKIPLPICFMQWITLICICISEGIWTIIVYAIILKKKQKCKCESKVSSKPLRIISTVNIEK